MTPEELGRRAVACKHWRWMRGMLSGTARIVDTKDMPTPYVYDDEWDDCGGLRRDALPDLSDPATLGCLLALVREAWPKGEATTNIHANYSPERGHYREWTCYYCTGNDWRQTHGPTEAEALVAALEAAP